MGAKLKFLLSILVFLAGLAVFVVIQSVMFRTALPYDAFLIANKIIGGCQRPMDNTAILGAIYSGLFFIISAIVAFGEGLNLMTPTKRVQSNKTLFWLRVRVMLGSIGFVCFGLLSIWFLNGMC